MTLNTATNATVLLTGSTGFIGRFVLQRLLDQGYRVVAPVRQPDKLADIKDHPQLTMFHGHFYENRMLERCAESKPDYIVHLAAIHGDWNGVWKDYVRVNINGTGRLIQFALREQVKSFVHCSSVGVYGTVPSRSPADPWTAAIPNTLFQTSKHRAEKLVYTKLQDQIPYAILRPATVYGPGDNGFLYKLINHVRNHTFPLIRKEIQVHLVDIATVEDIIIQALEQPLPNRCIVNVADAAPVQLKELVNSIHQYFYQTDYPERLSTSPLLFSIGRKTTRLLRIKRLHELLTLISNSWSYDTITLLQAFPELNLKDTLQTLDTYLHAKTTTYTEDAPKSLI